MKINVKKGGISEGFFEEIYGGFCKQFFRGISEEIFVNIFGD